MASGNPGERVAECIERLILGTEGIAPSRAKSDEAVAKAHPDVTEGRARVFAHYRIVCRNVAAIEADTFKERGGRGVALPEEELEVEAPARLIDHVLAENPRMGKRERVVAAFVLR